MEIPSYWRRIVTQESDVVGLASIVEYPAIHLGWLQIRHLNNQAVVASTMPSINFLSPQNNIEYDSICSCSLNSMHIFDLRDFCLVHEGSGKLFLVCSRLDHPRSTESRSTPAKVEYTHPTNNPAKKTRMAYS